MVSDVVNLHPYIEGHGIDPNNGYRSTQDGTVRSSRKVAGLRNPGPLIGHDKG